MFRAPTLDAYRGPLPTWKTDVGATATSALGDGTEGWYYFEAQTGIINIVWSDAGGTAATVTTGIQLDAAGTSSVERARYIYLSPGQKFTAIADGASKVLLYANCGSR